MAGQLYPSAREKFLTAQLSWISGVYRGLLLPQSYTPNFSNAFLSDIFAGVRIAISDPITDRTATDGYANCAAIKWGALVDSRLAAKLVIFKDTGVEATSDLICFFDEENLQGAPLELIGLDCFYMPNAVEGGIFRL